MTFQYDNRTNQLQIVDSGANASATFQAKGTGAINFAPGSSGLNLSNGGTVTAITRTATGNSYTSFPSIAISAPTTAGGVQATASTATMFATGATVVAGGTGYALNDVVTLSGGTPQTTGATYTVTGVSAGVVTAVTPLNYAIYTALPSNPVSVTGGTGSGLTLTVLWNWNSATITNAGSGYVEQPTVTFSGGGGSGAAAYATVGSGTVVRSLGGTMSFVTPNQQTAFQVADYGGSSGTGYWRTYGGNVQPILDAVASNSAVIQTASAVPMLLRTGGLEQLRVAHTASAVNYVQVTGAATGGATVISAQGSDSNININLQAKGAGQVRSIGWMSVGIGAPNYWQLASAASGAAPALSVQGSDTNIGLNLTTKGTGTLSVTTGGGTQFQVQDTFGSGSSTAYFVVFGRNSGSPIFSVQGSDTTINPLFSSKGSGSYLRFATGADASSANAAEQFRVNHTASAVNYVQVTGAATGNRPAFSAQGSDTNVGLDYYGKGSGAHVFWTNAKVQFVVAHTANADNFVQATGAAVGASPVISSQGADTNIDLTLTPKGTGNVRFGTYTGTALTITGYIEIKDAGGTIRRLAVVA